MSCPRRETSKILNMTFDPFMSQEAIEEAEKKLDTILEKAPDNTVLLQIGLTFLELGKPEKAEIALNKAETVLPGNPAVHLFKAILRYDQNNIEAAREELAKLEKITPGNQALPTMKVLCDLHEDKIKEALSVLLPPKGKFDITVSSYISSRLAMELEEKMLAIELGHLKNLPGNATADTAKDAPTTDAPATADSTASADNEAGTSADDATADKKPAGTGVPASDAKASKEPIIPEGSPLDLFLKDTSDLCEGTVTALSFKSSKRMMKAWELPEAKRKEEVNLALRELKTIYVKDPKSFQAAYNLGEALLVATELNHERTKSYAEEELNKIRACGQLLEISRKTEGDNAYVKHYHARVHYLLGNFTEAERLWKEALDAFNKFPEAHYGLGQTLVALGKKRSARMMICKSIMSDLHLLRDRINDLKEAYAK